MARTRKVAKERDVAGPPPTLETPLPLRIELLGAFRVSIGTRTIEAEAWRLRKAASLVKLLALAPDVLSHRLPLLQQPIR